MTDAGLPPDAEAPVLATLATMLRELRGTATEVALDDPLETTLGIDSLGRMELMLRLEKAFGVRMPEEAVQQAETPRDLLAALARARPVSVGGGAAADAVAGPPDAAVAMPAGRGPAAPLDALASAPHEPAVAPPSELLALRRAATLIEVLEAQARLRPDHVHVRLLDEDGRARPLGQRELLERARAVAAALARDGVAPGDSVALMLPTSLGFFVAFAGIWLAGAVPVPIYPPLRASQIEDHLKRQAGILENAQAVLLVADERTRNAARVLRAGGGTLRGVVDVTGLETRGRALPSAAGPLPGAARTAGDVALLQYTSGSTGQPKGVVMTHANLLANLRAMGSGIGASPADVFVSWLPLYHDMGLIGAWMGSLLYGMPLVLMPPQAFLARPARWLRAIDAWRGTLSAAPNFAYEILAARVPDDELRGLDLSSWRIAFNGAEPVQAGTLARFAGRFAAHGLRPSALMPVYGLAETGLGLTFPPPGRGPRIDTIDRSALRDDGRALPTAAPDAMPVVGCGVPLAGHEVRIVDASGAEAPERVEGRVEFRGPSATQGYFRNPEATATLVHGDWRDTGDVGYVADGELFLTSRVKDLIIRGGHNIHPYDLETAVGELPGVRKGCVAVFGAADPTAGTDRVVVLAETHEVDAQRRAALRERIAGLAVQLLGVPADDVVLAEPHTVPKTSSGKIRRASCRELYDRGALRAPRRAVWWQLARLGADAAWRRTRSLAARAAGTAYGLYAWAAYGAAAVVAFGVLAWLPGQARRRRGARTLVRAAIAAAGLPLTVIGEEHLLRERPAVYVSNHASYVDWLLLLAVLPPQACVVAKRELTSNPVFRFLLERGGTRFVTRDDVHAGVEDTRALEADARAGVSLAFFPEGTFRRSPGLLPFHLGAFVVAARAGRPVQPVSLRGSRSVMRAGSWWPRREPVAVRVHPPIEPAGAEWADAIALRDAAHRAIAQDVEAGAAGLQ